MQMWTESTTLAAVPDDWPSGRAGDAHADTTRILPVGREHNGGLLDLVILHRLVERRRGSAADPVSLDDILQAIKKLEVCSQPPVACRIPCCQDLGCRNATSQLRVPPSWGCNPALLMQDDTGSCCRCLGAASELWNWAIGSMWLQCPRS